MHVEATTAPPLATDADTIVVGLFEGDETSSRVSEGLFSELVRSGEARRQLEKVAVLHAAARRLILAGLGPREGFGPEQARLAAASVHARAAELSTRVLCWELPQVGDGLEEERILAGLIEGTLLHAYRFERYRERSREEDIERLIVSTVRNLQAQAQRAEVITTAQNRARDLGNTPGNDLPPAALAEYARDMAARHTRLRTTILDEQAIRQAGMGAFAAVAQGSAQEARLIRLDYEPESSTGPWLGFVGKGLTFDSGGLSLKRADDMDEMKFDMCGGAAVIEALGALAELETPVRVTGVIGAAENLPGGSAVKPGDIVRAMDGTTIEINNTDAEGRLVLADCLLYARQQGAQRLVDIATLTGGVVIALGSVYAGLMSNDPEWSKAVEECGARSGERMWPLPLDERYARMMEGRYAQLTNRSERREAMAITAAELLHHFAADVPWAHVDIAGTAWDVPRPYYVGNGATGFGVRLLVEVARSVT